MRKIAVIATGGTIEMATIQGKADFSSTNYIKKMLDTYLAESGREADLVRFSRLDSSNMGPDQWQSLISCINERKDKYKGFVITHGTDTMPYTAAALAFSLHPILDFPILLTGSMRTPNSANSDAESNLSAALQLAVSDMAEVAIVIQGRAWRGACAQKTTGLDVEAFTTPGISCLARLDQHNQPQLYAHAARRHRPAGKASGLRNAFSRNICFLPAVPGVRPPAALEKGVKTVLLTASGGNLTPDFLDFMYRNRHAGITHIIGSTVANRGSVVYPPLERALEMGALAAVKYSPAALIVKVSFLLAQSEEAGHTDAERTEFIRQELAVSYAGEI